MVTFSKKKEKMLFTYGKKTAVSVVYQHKKHVIPHLDPHETQDILNTKFIL